MVQSLYKEAGMRALVATVPLTAIDIAVIPSPAVSGTTFTAGTGQGAAFAEASLTNPYLLYHNVLNEVVYVTGRSGDILTIVRARDGTTAATWVTGTAVLNPGRPVVFPRANKFDLNANLITLVYSGDGGSERLYLPNGITGSFAVDKQGSDLFQYVAGITPMTTLTRSDEATRWYNAQGNYPNVQLDAYFKVTRDDQQGQFTRLRLTVIAAKVQGIFLPGSAANNAVQTTTVAWSATGQLVDILGRALPNLVGSPPTPQEIYMSELIAAAA